MKTVAEFKDISYYQNFNIYDHFKEKLPNEIKRFSSVRTFKKGELIYIPGEILHHMFEIVEGAVKLGSYSEDGEEVIYDVLSKGDFFGNLKYLNGQFFEFSKVLADTKVRFYDLAFFKEAIVSDHEISDWFHYYLVKRWCSAELKIVKINAKNVMEKLQFLYDRFGYTIEDANGKKFVLFDLLTKKDLGDIIGATRQTVASSLKKFKAEMVMA